MTFFIFFGIVVLTIIMISLAGLFAAEEILWSEDKMIDFVGGKFIIKDV